MPVDRRAILQLGLLLLAVPAQYLITKYLYKTDGERTVAIKTMFSTAKRYKNEYLSWEKWQKWCLDIYTNIKNLKYPLLTTDPVADDMGESPAIEVMKYRDPQGWFGGSTAPRNTRPSSVLYRVGQVVRHKQWGYRGIIVGWDLETKAPEEWIKEMHPADKPHWRKQPNYAILVDTRDRMVPQRTYVPQDNIEIISNTKVIHPEVDDYFEAFDGAQYLPRPSLKRLYPKD